MKASCFTEWIRHPDGRGVQSKRSSCLQCGCWLAVRTGIFAGTETVVPIKWHEEDAEPVRVAVVQINPKTKLEESGN
ncbi:MAG: hypothetical protein JWR26_4445 [Pedosphaera sp.]|nr:hypothetical protein [Pedosphaera sp.]